MNFVAHGLLAARHGLPPAAVLGAMVPDFAGVAALRIDRSAASSEVLAGLRHHSAADDAFHTSQWFGELCAMARAAIGEQARRGARAAAGHVAVELVLDGMLVNLPEVNVMWQQAWLAVGDVHPLVGDPAWPVVLERWRDSGLPVDLVTADGVARRIIRMLSFRPRLAADEASAEAIERACPQIAEYLAGWGPSWLERVDAAMR